MKTLVIYYSLTGNTDYAAKKIADILQVDIYRLHPEKEFPSSGFGMYYRGGKSAVFKETPALSPIDIDLSVYERILIGTPVWAGTMSSPVYSFLKEYKDILKDKEIAVFCSCSGGKTEKAFAAFKETLGISSLRAELRLVDPLEKPDEANEKGIEEFCKRVD